MGGNVLDKRESVEERRQFTFYSVEGNDVARRVSSHRTRSVQLNRAV